MRFSRKAQSAYSILLLPQSLDTFQCRTYSAQFPLPGEHSLPGIAACDNGACKFKHNHLSHPTGVPIYTPGSRAAMWINCLAEGQKCMAIVRFEPGLSAWESSEYSNSPQHLHKSNKLICKNCHKLIQASRLSWHHYVMVKTYQYKFAEYMYLSLKMHSALFT